MTRRRLRALAAIAGLLGAAPALAYLLPVRGILKRLANRREALALHAFEVRGTFAMSGEPARAAAAAAGLPLTGSELSLPALLVVKTPGRCRFELAPPNAPVSSRPAVVSRQGKLIGSRGLDRVPATAALVRGVCALLGERAGGAEADRAWAQALTAVGVPLGDVHLGRFSGRIAYVLGARPSEAKPQAWVDKQSFQPLRLVAPLTGAGLADVRLLDYGSPTGGDGFPRAIEVWEAKEMKARFTTEKVSANPRIPDSIF